MPMPWVRRSSPYENNTPILLRDVADIKTASAVRSGDSLIMGRPGVLLSLASQYGANTLSTTLEVEKALAGLDPALKKQGIQMYTSLHRPATFIERALQNLRESLVIAAVLILAVLYVFLRKRPRGIYRVHGHPSVPARSGRRAAPHGADAQHDDARWIRRGTRCVGR